jgi:hypothetical protein
MSKSIEFKVEISQASIGGTKTKTYLAKSVDRLIKSMPKSIKKKWQTISFTDENGKSKILDRSYNE